MQDKNANEIIIVTYETIKHKMKQTRLWCKIVPQINLEQIEDNGVLFFKFIPFGDLIQKTKFMKGFHMNY